MDMIKQIIAYIAQDPEKYRQCIIQHLALDAVAFAIAVAIAVPLGYACAKKAKLAVGILLVVNIIMVVPSLAIFALLRPVLGFGTPTALVALLSVALPHMVINTMAAIRGVDPYVLENAKGMGMEPWRVCLTVELPLALPAILNGARITAVSLIAGTTIAAYVNAGGLGAYIVLGLGTNRMDIMYVGAITVAAIAVAVDRVLAYFQRKQLKKL